MIPWMQRQGNLPPNAIGRKGFREAAVAAISECEALVNSAGSVAWLRLWYFSTRNQRIGTLEAIFIASCLS
jgi:hypothetical protein